MVVLNKQPWKNIMIKSVMNAEELFYAEKAEAEAKLLALLAKVRSYNPTNIHYGHVGDINYINTKISELSAD